MEQSGFPTKISLPFGANAASSNIRTIPAAADDDVSASFSLGFPPLTMTPTDAGGTPPDGRDMNGVLFMSTALLLQYCAGAVPAFDAAFQANIGGYPLNAIVSDKATAGLFWYSTADNNLTTLGASDADWRAIVCDASLTGWTQILTTQYLTKPVWARYLEVILIGGGGGGAGCQATSLSQTAYGAGGGGGGVIQSRHLVSSVSTIAVYIGSGGSGGSGAVSGGKGGDTYLVLDESTVSTAGGANGGDTYNPGGSSGGAGGSNTFVSGGLIASYSGSDGADSQSTGLSTPGNGAAGYLGQGSGRAGLSGGASGTSPGAGAGGAYDPQLSGTSYSGGSGYSGACLYRWLP